MIELPKGVKPMTGLLFAKADHGNVAAGVDDAIVLRIQPGPGFAVGLHGFNIIETALPGGDGNGWRWELGSNTDITAVQDGLGNDILYMANQRIEITTSGGPMPWTPDRYYNTGPLLVIRDVISRYNSLVGTSAAKVSIYYAIYEVSDSDFLRIAGFQLASRSSN